MGDLQIEGARVRVSGRGLGDQRYGAVDQGAGFGIAPKAQAKFQQLAQGVRHASMSKTRGHWARALLAGAEFANGDYIYL